MVTPKSFARPVSLSAPARISDADAEPLSTSTATGMSARTSEELAFASYTVFSLGTRSLRVLTTGPPERKKSATCSTDDRRPPGFWRTSTTIAR